MKWSHGKQYTPMSFARAATGLRSSATNFLASRRISMMLLSRAKSGANGNDATNSVTKPNWITAHNNNKHHTQLHKTLHKITNDSRLWFKTLRALETIGVDRPLRAELYPSHSALISQNRPSKSVTIQSVISMQH